jgi:hypothetical protein
MAQSRRIVSHPRIVPHSAVISHPSTHDGGAQRANASENLKQVPWTTIVLLILLLILMLTLWGKLPTRLRRQHQAPAGNAPGVAVLAIDNPHSI